MATKYARQAASVLRLIQAKGVGIAMVVPVAGTIDPDTDISTGDGTISATVSAVILKGPVPLTATFEQATQILQNARKLLVAGLGCPVAEIPPDTKFTFEGADWFCKGSSPISPDGGDPVYHTVVVQR